MEKAAIREHRDKDPFAPFEVVTSSGDRYEVRSPDQMMFLKTRVLIAVPPAPGEEPTRFADLSLLHVVGVEQMHAA